jgi:DNA-binding XRE family transcriptional regulator
MSESKTNLQARFISLRATGFSLDKCSKELGKAKNTLVSWEKEFKKNISMEKAIEIERILEHNNSTKLLRINLLSKQVKDIFNEIAKRNLSDIKTEKLMELGIKHIAALEEMTNNMGWIEIEDKSVLEDVLPTREVMYTLE